MDSERKHELETNDLKEFLDNFKDFWDKHGNKLLMFLIVVLGSFAGYNYYSDWQDNKLEDATQALNSATTAVALHAIAEEHPLVFDEAKRREADIYFAEARSDRFKDKDTKKTLKSAGDAYTALTTQSDSPLYQLVGYEGLAKVAIMSGDSDKAQAHYNKVKELAGETYPAYAARAQTGLDQLDLIKNPIAFAVEDDLSFNPDVLPDDDADTSDGEREDGPANDPLTPIESILPDIDLSDIDPAQPGN